MELKKVFSAGDASRIQKKRTKLCRVFEFCGWTVHREGPCFLADSQSRFRWPSCVSQWHGASVWHAWDGASSSLTSYSRFLIFSGLYESWLLVLLDQSESQGSWSRTHTHTRAHSLSHVHRSVLIISSVQVITFLLTLFTNMHSCNTSDPSQPSLKFLFL